MKELARIKIIKETEKAINVEVKLIIQGKPDYMNWNIWLPKSQIERNDNAILIPEWLRNSKINEIIMNTPFGNRVNGILIK